MVGRTDMMKVDKSRLVGKARSAQLESLLENPFTENDVKRTYIPSESYDFKIEKAKDETILCKQLRSKLEKEQLCFRME